MQAISINTATVKLTVSVKRRLGSGDEVFIAPGIEMMCPVDELDATQESVTARVNGWMERLLADYPDPADAEDDATDDADDADADDDSDDADDDDGGVTEEEINAMSLADLKTFVKENDLDVDLKGLKVAAAREAVIAAVFSGDDDDDEDDDADDDDADAEEDGDGDEDGYTEDELRKMKLEELQEIITEWGIGDPKIKKGADVKAKKAAYVAHILAAQEEAED